ncbi:hypothetical protein [Jannaschia seohaensis]|uniref:Uncharacterized protein n=1 Tax=Jannaschia seohaensis TaxID=475081 RepID=A0A2Y9B4P1_9RHOB|nr:hypothetical protein [Jannaschia seohaensis]PWJ11183.1 hypothetical protein BCF38_12027 [Jannaschia seohaensis]SSA51484.1 hypothetical protein SAMN05421539_12027 [Jannaschia seohaensis]
MDARIIDHFPKLEGHVPNGSNLLVALVPPEDMVERPCPDVWPHHEFARVDGKIAAFDLRIIWFRDAARLREFDATHEAGGFSVADAHTPFVEGGD